MKKNKGFTLIEMILVIGSIGLTLPLLFSIIFTILQQQVKISRLTEVKKQGDYILNVITNTIRNYAVTIHSALPPNQSNLTCNFYPEQPISVAYFLDKYTTYFRFCKSSDGINCDDNNNYIASFSSILNNGSPLTIPLNNNKIKITDFTLTCYKKTQFASPVVGIKFTISYNTSSTRPEENAQMTYQTKVKLRIY